MPTGSSCAAFQKLPGTYREAVHFRWAVKNQLPVMTPQAYVDGTRVCDADTDLGLDYVLARLLERGGSR